MRLVIDNLSPVFGRKLKTSEEAYYAEVLRKGREKLCGKNYTTSLIIPSASLPQNSSNNTGVGNIASPEAQQFFDFAKKYWGINEIQLLPEGQYHFSHGEYPLYSGTTMDFGNHIIDIKSFVSEKDFNRIVKNNSMQDRINFSNIIDPNSIQEKVLKELYSSLDEQTKQEFELFKTNASNIIETKGLYQALAEIHGSFNFNKWNDLDKNLFNDDYVSLVQREERIREIKNQKSEAIDFYKFKQFLAEKSFNKAKKELNAKGIKLSGDVPCNISANEKWAYPKAFIQDTTMRWGVPALDYESKEAEQFIREKINFYAKHYDRMRIDAGWAYISPIIQNYNTGEARHKDYGDKILNIIEDEVKKVKEREFDLKNIRYEFAADSKEFSIFQGRALKPYLKDRVKIYTSDYLSNDWGSSDNFVKTRGWSQDSFMLGMTNHDSSPIKISDTQKDVLSKILKIPKEKLNTMPEFLKAKFAEPMGAKNMMLFFMDALGIEGKYKGNSDKSLNYTTKVSESYEDFYHNSLKNGKGFNPMDALEKQFVAQGLDKTEPKLYRKIVKYRDILADKPHHTPYLKYLSIGLGASILMFGTFALSYKYAQNVNSKQQAKPV